MNPSEGNGHKYNIHPITDEALQALTKQMQSILAQAFFEATANRSDDLIGTGKTVASLVANIDDAAFRGSLNDFLLWLKIYYLLVPLKDPPFEVVTEEEFKELQDYLGRLRRESLRAQNDPLFGMQQSPDIMPEDDI